MAPDPPVTAIILLMKHASPEGFRPKRKPGLILSGMVLFSLTLVLACAQATRKGSSSSGPTSTGDSSEVSPSTSVPPPDIFPHPDDWKKADVHGALVLQTSPTACLECHKTYTITTEAIPACGDCHPLYPHSKDWAGKDRHGSAAIAKGVGTCATSCHGANLQGGLSKVSCNACHANFPHAPTWSAPSQHGLAARGTGKDSCRGCHGDDLQGGISKVSCILCHENYPHDAGWADPQKHGAFVASKGQASCATSCHGYDLQGGLSEVSCTLCHTSFPHTTDWVTPSRHGDAALGEGGNTCRSCHGQDLLGGWSQVSCTKCHANYPHPSNWNSPDQHGTFVLDQGKASCQTQCHGQDLKGGLSKTACDSCHKIYPHAPAWDQDHGASYKTLGREACTGCHGADLKKVLGDKNCTSCHADYPHPDQALWTPYDGGHGERIQVALQGQLASCQTCHGEDLKAPQNGKTCFSCHPSYPHQKISATDWGTYEGHGSYSLSHSKEECLLCHGTDLKGGAHSETSCFSCHTPYPHLTGWVNPLGQPQGHGIFVEVSGSASCATARCHGINLIPENGVSKGVGCNTCHGSYPHSPDWKNGLTHGPAALADISLCKACHGEALNTSPPGFKTCVDCHATYLKHSSAGLAGPAWDTWQGHGQYLMSPEVNNNQTECKLCHGADLAGGLSNKSCMTCHPSYPHLAPDWNTKEGHGNYVHATLSNDLNPCRVCHGNDLLGGNAKVSCAQCHPGYPHPGGWSTGAGHGQTFSSQYSSLSGDASCWNCHNPPVDLNPTQTKPMLSQVSLCYQCHWAYPHPGYVNPAQGIDEAWSPPDGWGHVYYLIQSPLLTTQDGTHPSSNANNLLWPQAEGYTCGGSTDGNCHSNGFRSVPNGTKSALCAGYCHKPPPAPPAPPEPCVPEEDEC